MIFQVVEQIMYTESVKNPTDSSILEMLNNFGKRRNTH